MSRFAAFLRGMNVGGHRLANEELRAHFVAMGFGDVATFRASGNVIFAALHGEVGQPPRATLRERIEEGLQASLGYAVPTFIRTEAEVRAIAALQPFDPERLRGSAGKLQVALLAAPPSPRARAEVLSLASEEDGLVLGEHELYWLPSGGILHSALEMKGIERLLGAMTMRTKSTIELIAGRYFAADAHDSAPPAR
jgi:uncharacterized protein (DUF1697 family)